MPAVAWRGRCGGGLTETRDGQKKLLRVSAGQSSQRDVKCSDDSLLGLKKRFHTPFYLLFRARAISIKLAVYKNKCYSIQGSYTQRWKIVENWFNAN